MSYFNISTNNGKMSLKGQAAPPTIQAASYNIISSTNLIVFYTFNNNTYTSSSSTTIANFANGTAVYDCNLSSNVSNCISIDDVNTQAPNTGSLICNGSYTAIGSLTPTYPFNLPSATNGNGFTITCWIKVPTANTLSSGVLYTIYNGAIYMYVSSSIKTNISLQFKGDNLWGTTASSGTQDISDGKWHFCVGTVLCTGSNNCTVSCYFDNNLVNSINSTTYPTSSYSITKIKMDGFYDNGNPGSYAFSNGNLDNFRFYNRVLTISELTTLFQTGN